MGGNALAKTVTERIGLKEYTILKDEILPIVQKYFSKFAVPLHLEKESFGDIDVIVSTTDSTVRESVSLLFKEIESKEIVINGPVSSMEFKNFQLDIIATNESYVQTTFSKQSKEVIGTFQMCVDFMSWGDLGTLIGIMAKKMNLKFGIIGLELPIYYWLERDGQTTNNDSICFDSKTKPIILDYLILSTDMKQILIFLGFDYEVWKNGFRNEDEIFHFVRNSKYYKPELFVKATVGTANRKRLTHRPMFKRFLDGSDAEVKKKKLKIENLNVAFSEEVVIGEFYDEIDPLPFKNYHYKRALTVFDKQDFFDNFYQKKSKKVLFKKKFNSMIVSKITNIHVASKSLEPIIAKFKAKFENEQVMIDEVLEMEDETLVKMIQDLSKLVFEK